MDTQFQAIDEAAAGARWVSLFHTFWPAYQKWFLRKGLEARPTRIEAERALATHMPELLPTYHTLVELAGGGDVAARCLALYRPPTYLSACSQAAWCGAPSPMLIRNYDYSPLLWEGVFLRSSWLGRGVLSMVDCLWGALDGINDAGLAVSLAFGGSRAVGDGFGIPLIVRYVLETCDTLESAVRALCRIPSHMAYNVTVLDRTGQTATVYLGPDREPRVDPVAVATNHQDIVRWRAYVEATRSRLRHRLLRERLADPAMTAEAFVEGFLEAPIYSDRFRRGWGTLYTVTYQPIERCATFRWPGLEPVCLGLDEFAELARTLRFTPGRAKASP